MTNTPTIVDVTDATFATEVIQRSQEVAVVVDFWAAWCGPCRTLGPMLEDAVNVRHGEVVLAKVDVDANPAIAQQFRVQGIPQVFAFRDGKVVDQFTGVIPAGELQAFFDRLVPSPTDRELEAVAQLPADERLQRLRAIVDDDPGHSGAVVALAAAIVDDEPAAALELIQPLRPAPDAEQIAARAELARHRESDLDGLQAALNRGEQHVAPELGAALAAQQRYEEAITVLLAGVAAGGTTRDEARAQLVALFAVLGDDDPRVSVARRKLAAALF